MPGKWSPASYGAGARHWYVYRDALNVADRYHNGTDGRLIHYGSYKSAQATADRLNKQKGSQ